MPTVASTRKQVQTVLWDFEQETYTKGIATVPVKKGSAAFTTGDILGYAVIWDNSISAFRPVVNADTIPGTASTLPNAAPVAVVVGLGDGVGDNSSNVTLSSTSTFLTVVYRDAAVISEGIVFDAGVLAGTQTLIKGQLEKQEVVVRSKSTSVTQTFVS